MFLVGDLLNIYGTFKGFADLKHITPKTIFMEYASLTTAGMYIAGTKDRAGEMKNMASLRNSTRAKRSSKLRESMKSDNVHGNVNKLSVKEKRQFILAASVRENFLKDLENTKAKKINLGATRKERKEDLGRSYNRGDDVDTSESGEKIFGIMARERTRRRSNRERKSAQNQDEITQL